MLNLWKANLQSSWNLIAAFVFVSFFFIEKGLVDWKQNKTKQNKTKHDIKVENYASQLSKDFKPRRW